MRLASFSAVAVSSLILIACTVPPTKAASKGASALPATATGANVDETKATQVLFVNNQSSAASDSNAGTESAPFLTISKAVRAAQTLNKNNTGVRIYIEPGIYRESITVSQSTSAPIILEGTSRGNVIVSGSDLWNTGWTPAGAPNLYQHAWPYTWGLAPYPQGWQGNVVLQDLVRRREMILINGHNLTQVLQSSDLADFSFFADEGAHIIYMQLGANMPIDGNTIEVGIRPRIFTAQNVQNLVVRDLVFEHGNAAVQDSAVTIADSTNVLVEGCTFRWNNWIGLGLSGDTNLSLLNSVGDRNGATGYDVYNMKNLVLDSNETSYNNWRGARGNFYGWSVAGAKLGGVHLGRVSSHASAGNRARGIWLDYDNRDMTVDTVTLAYNYNDGMFIEANPGPILVQNSTIVGNQLGAGISGANSTDITIQNNAISGNTIEQILITGDSDRTVVNWENNVSMDLQPARWTIRSNTITSQDNSQALFVMSQKWSSYLTTLSADYNVWATPGQQLFQVGTSWLNFPQWQTLVQADLTSVFQP